MLYPHIPLCYYPTSTLLISEDSAFAERCREHASQPDLLKHFTSEQEALRYINCFSNNNPLKTQHPSSLLETEALSIESNVKRIQFKREDKRKTDEPSVVIIDSEFNALNICRQIANPHIKKVMLAGNNDRQVIDAFNQRLIDYSIIKSDSDVLSSIDTAITELQHYYFQLTSTPLHLKLTSQLPFIADQSVARIFFDICENMGVREYYFTPAPNGFILVTKNNSLYRLTIYDNEDLAGHYDIAEDANAPKGLLNAIEARTSIPCFLSDDEFYHPGIENWEQHMKPASKLQGQKEYFYAVYPLPIV